MLAVNERIGYCFAQDLLRDLQLVNAPHTPHYGCPPKAFGDGDDRSLHHLTQRALADGLISEPPLSRDALSHSGVNRNVHVELGKELLGVAPCGQQSCLCDSACYGEVQAQHLRGGCVGPT